MNPLTVMQHAADGIQQQLPEEPSRPACRDNSRWKPDIFRLAPTRFPTCLMLPNDLNVTHRSDECHCRL